MKNFFSMDAPLFRILSTLYDLIILNLLTALGCLPVVTIGASLTAMHFVLIAMVRDEEPDIARSFLRSFRENFRQSTLVWGFYLLTFVLCFPLFRSGSGVLNAVPGIVLILLYLPLSVSVPRLFPEYHPAVCRDLRRPDGCVSVSHGGNGRHSRFVRRAVSCFSPMDCPVVRFIRTFPAGVFPGVAVSPGSVEIGGADGRRE